jgi:PadR family transcriptional regulator PadR
VGPLLRCSEGERFVRVLGKSGDFLHQIFKNIDCYSSMSYSAAMSTSGQAVRSWAAQMRKGLIELCVMAALKGGEAYGYQILQRLGRAEALTISESAVYPILARLAAEGMVKVRVGPSPSGPPRRYYRLTAQGEARLTEMAEQWRQTRRAIDLFFAGD